MEAWADWQKRSGTGPGTCRLHSALKPGNRQGFALCRHARKVFGLIYETNPRTSLFSMRTPVTTGLALGTITWQLRKHLDTPVRMRESSRLSSARSGALRWFDRVHLQCFPDRRQHSIVRGQHFMLPGRIRPPGKPQFHHPASGSPKSTTRASGAGEDRLYFESRIHRHRVCEQLCIGNDHSPPIVGLDGGCPGLNVLDCPFEGV